MEISQYDNLPYAPYDQLAQIVGALGERDFAHKLLKLLESICGAQHCSLLYLTEQEPAPLLAVSYDGTGTGYVPVSGPAPKYYWQDDTPLLHQISSVGVRGLSITKFRTADVPAPTQRHILYRSLHIGERILLCGRTGKHTVGLSALRNEELGGLSASSLAQLSLLSEILVSTLDRHIEMVTCKARSPVALDSTEDMEEAFASDPFHLPPREAQVCARILHGMTNTGISIDLGITEATAMTYRKRAYQRLTISGQNELLRCYLRRSL